MIVHNNGRNQVALSQNPGKQQEREIFFPLQGRVSGIRHANTVKGKITLVHLYLYDGYPPLYNVPVSHGKINAVNGEQWSPEENDEVLVQFINGNINRPVVTGCMPPSDNGIVEGEASEHPRYFMQMNGTWDNIKKNGDREQYVINDKTTTVQGIDTTTVKEGNKVSTVESGDYLLAIDTGKFEWTIAAGSKITVPELTIDGNLIVTGDITSSGGNVSSTTGNVSDSAGTLANNRYKFNLHTHNENGDGGGITDAPNQTQP